MFGSSNSNGGNRKNDAGSPFGSSSAGGLFGATTKAPTFSFGASGPRNQHSPASGLFGNRPSNPTGGGFNFGGSSDLTVRSAVSKDKQISTEKDESLRTEFQDLMKMMKLLELSEREEKDAKIKMDSCDEKHQLANNAFKEKKDARELSQSDLASSLTNAGTNIAEDKENTGKAELEELEILIISHLKIIEEEEVSKKKLEDIKKALDEATSDFMKKKEKRDQVQSDLSSSFIDAGKNLVQNQEAQETKEKQLDECAICCEKYNKLDRHSCAPIHCGHLTCEKCLNELPEKICPSCRKPFTENDIIKIYLK